MIDQHLTHLRRLNRRPSAIQQRRWALYRLARCLAPTPITEATTEQILEFLDRPSERTGYHERGPSARATEISHLRGFYQWLLWEEIRFDDPTFRIVRPRIPRRLPRPMPDHHVAQALSDAPERIRPWLWFAAYAGLRACEIAPLRREDIIQGIILVRERKGGDEGVVPLSTQLDPILAPLPKSGWLFPHRGRGQAGPTSAGQVQRLSNRWLREADIPYTLHTLRHWCGTWALRVSGGDLRRVQELLGHKTPATTALYTLILVDEVAETVAKLPDLRSLRFPRRKAA